MKELLILFFYESKRSKQYPHSLLHKIVHLLVKLNLVLHDGRSSLDLLQMFLVVNSSKYDRILK